MMDKRTAIGIRDLSFELTTVGELVKRGFLERPIDGNHGEIHPKASDFVDEGVPFIMASDLKNGRVDYDNCAFITERQAEGLRKGFAKNGDVLLTHKATIGETAIVDYDQHPYIMLTPQVTYYRVKDHSVLNNRYLKAYFDSALFQQTLQMLAGSGSTRAYLGITEQHRLPIILPPPDKQEKIAAVLATLEDLIANNQRRIALLESMAEEIYREWFVRMRFPGHESAVIEKGIPRGWLASTAAEMVHVLGGGTPSTEVSQYWAGEIPFFSPKDSHDGAYCLHTEQTITELGLENCSSKLFPKDTIFITARGTVGNIVLAGESMAMNQSCYALVPKLDLKPHFVFTGLKCAVNVIKGVSNSGVFDNVVMDTFKIIPLINPGDELRKKYIELAEPIYEQSLALRKSTAQLRLMRDALLPRLISGKLRVDQLDIQCPPSMRAETAEAAP
jgi:type I restriction enzyme, S subunit